MSQSWHWATVGFWMVVFGWAQTAAYGQFVVPAGQARHLQQAQFEKPATASSMPPIINTSLSDFSNYYQPPAFLDDDASAVRPMPSTGFEFGQSSWISPPSNPEFFRTFHHQPFLGSSAYQRSTANACDCGSCARCQDIWIGLCREGECCGDFGVSAFDWFRRRTRRAW
mgnify:CR=1 FL=1